MLTTALLRNRLLAIVRDVRSRLLYAIGIAFGCAVFAGIFFGTSAGTRVLAAASATGLIRSVPAWAFLIYLFTDVLIAFGQALGDLYLASDMPVLLAMPLRMSNILVAKFVVGTMQNEVYAIVFLLPFSLGYLKGLGAPEWAYWAAAFGTLVFPATLYAVLVMVTVAALRYIPPKIAKEGLWLVGAAVPTVFWIISFYRLVQVGGDVRTMQLPATPQWLPSTWMGTALTLLGQGDAHAWAWIAVLVGFTLAAGPIAMGFASSSFARGWSATAAASSRRSVRPSARIEALSPSASIVRKDLLTFARTPQLWFNHIPALGFVGYLVIGHAAQSPLVPLTIQLAMAQIGFAAVLAALYPGMTALSLEHLAVWIIKSAPVSARDVVSAKFATAYFQTGVMSAVAAIVLARGYHFGATAALALIVFSLASAASAVCVGMAFDATHPCFTWDNPNYINRGLRMVVPLLTNIAVLTVVTIALFASRSLLAPPAAVAAGLLFSAAAFGSLCWLGLRVATRATETLQV